MLALAIVPDVRYPSTSAGCNISMVVKGYERVYDLRENIQEEVRIQESVSGLAQLYFILYITASDVRETQI